MMQRTPTIEAGCAAEVSHDLFEEPRARSRAAVCTTAAGTFWPGPCGAPHEVEPTCAFRHTL